MEDGIKIIMAFENNVMWEQYTNEKTSYRKVLTVEGLIDEHHQVITLVKDTSLARVIAVEEILFVAFNRFVSKGIIWPLFYSGAFYLIFVGILTLLFGYLEKKLDYFKA